MNPISEFPLEKRAGIAYVLTDIDDTITNEGRMPACAYRAMEALCESGIRVVPITGRPAGWCDHIARMWPVSGVVGENGAFYFAYDSTHKKMIRRYFKSRQERDADKSRLDRIKQEILEKIPGCRVSADQAYREADLAIDFCEDVPPLPPSDIQNIVDIFERHHAVAKISSIHVNGWFGTYDKLSMTRLFFREIFHTDLEAVKDTVVFSGDSPNDEPMFEYFPNATGVANILEFKEALVHQPAWITSKKGGQGFAELADILLTR